MPAIRQPFAFAVSASLAALLSTTALADPPARVGRLSDVEGTVSFHSPQDTQWNLAQLNYPVTTGDAIWNEPGARAEVEVGSQGFRLDGSTELDVTELGDRATRLSVPQGVVNIHLLSIPEGGVQVTTPEAAVNLIEPGRYNIDAGHPNGAPPAGQSRFTVLEGRATVSGPGGQLNVQAGASALVSGNPPSFQLAQGGPTDFDNWALSRERVETAPISAHYVSPQTTGYQQLDQYGQWQQTPQYGAVWYPQVAEGWAPYQEGHWAYVQPWGWTWIDAAPWGFAPFHYGRWVQTGPRWGWVPGRPDPRPVYAPALVAFIGAVDIHVSVHDHDRDRGPVGWVPLAPREVYHPYYQASPNYVRDVNRYDFRPEDSRRIDFEQPPRQFGSFVNRNAASLVPAADFTRGAPVRRSLLADAGPRLGHDTAERNPTGLTPNRDVGHGAPHPQIPAIAASSPIVQAQRAQQQAVEARQAEKARIPAQSAQHAALPPAPSPAHNPVAAASPIVQAQQRQLEAQRSSAPGEGGHAKRRSQAITQQPPATRDVRPQPNSEAEVARQRESRPPAPQAERRIARPEPRQAHETPRTEIHPDRGQENHGGPPHSENRRNGDDRRPQDQAQPNNNNH